MYVRVTLLTDHCDTNPMSLVRFRILWHTERDWQRHRQRLTETHRQWLTGTQTETDRDTQTHRQCPVGGSVYISAISGSIVLEIGFLYSSRNIQNWEGGISTIRARASGLKSRVLEISAVFQNDVTIYCFPKRRPFDFPGSVRYSKSPNREYQRPSSKTTRFGFWIEILPPPHPRRGPPRNGRVGVAPQLRLRNSLRKELSRTVLELDWLHAPI